MKKKRFLVTLMIIGLIITMTMGVSAAEETATSGGMNIDKLIHGSKLMDVDAVVKGASLSSATSSSSKTAAAGGGNFWVVWGLDRHYSNYEHETKIHKASAGNSNGTTIGSWMPAGVLAQTMSYSTLWGNTAYWDVQ